jgi:predicted DNA-binding transcriptional regulator AlpA
MATALPEPRTADPSISHDVLERLEAIYMAVQQAPASDQAIRLPEVQTLLGGISKSTWYARLNPRSPSYDPRAPKPFKLGTSERSPSVWWRSAVMAYALACANARASSAGGDA